MSKKTQILVCAHKEAPIPNNDLYLPIQVGRAVSNRTLDMIGDDTGENISAKNPHYCELTALYWAWKNLPSDVEFVGLNHYRRYFYFGNSKRDSLPISKEQIQERAGALTQQQIETELASHDVIMARRKIYPYPVMVDYCSCHIVEDLAVMNSVIKKLHPEYTESFDRFWAMNNKFSPYNMFIMRRENFDGYCSWLFSIMDEAEKHIRISPYQVQARVFGYLSERLLNLYCYHNKLKINYKTVDFVYDQSPSELFRTDWYRNFRNELTFRSSKGILRNKRRYINMDYALNLNGIKI